MRILLITNYRASLLGILGIIIHLFVHYCCNRFGLRSAPTICPPDLDSDYLKRVEHLLAIRDKPDIKCGRLNM